MFTEPPRCQLEPWPSLKPELVPEEFRQQVAQHLLVAHQGVLELYPHLEASIKAQRQAARRCVQCGGLLDDQTPTCRLCSARHNQRRSDSRRGANGYKPRREPKWRWGEGRSRRTEQRRRAKALANRAET